MATTRTRLALSAMALGAIHAASTPSARAASPIAYGYPYAQRCPEAGIAEVVDRWGMYACNCTSYVAWALTVNGQRTDWFVRGAMDARNWPHVAQLARIPTGRAPRVGAVAVWPALAPPFGHIAYVTGVDPDGKIDVSEYNLAGDEGADPFSFDSRTRVSTAGAVFIYVPRRRR